MVDLPRMANLYSKRDPDSRLLTDHAMRAEGKVFSKVRVEREMNVYAPPIGDGSPHSCQPGPLARGGLTWE